MKGLQRWLTKTSALAGVEGTATKAIPKWRGDVYNHPAKAWKRGQRTRTFTVPVCSTCSRTGATVTPTRSAGRGDAQMGARDAGAVREGNGRAAATEWF